MNAKSVWLATLSLAAVGLFAGACAGGSSEPQNSPADNHGQGITKPPVGKNAAMFNDADVDYAWQIFNDQGSGIGTVAVYNDAEQVFVSIDLAGSYGMSAAQLYLAATPPASTEDPQAFPFKETFSQAMNTYTFYIPLAQFSGAAKLYAAVHADISGGQSAWVGSPGDTAGVAHAVGKPSLTEMAEAPVEVTAGSAAKEEFVEDPGGVGNLVEQTDPAGQYIAVTLHPVFAPITDWHNYVANSGSTPSTWGIRFGSTDWLPFDVPENMPAWCVDMTHAMFTGIPYAVQVYSCYDPDLPALAKSGNWDMISYLITQRNNSHSGIYNQDWSDFSRIQEFQEAVWYFKGGGSLPADNTLARQLVADAVANGDDFVPGEGEFQAIVLLPDTATNDPNERAQMNVGELEVFGPMM